MLVARDYPLSSGVALSVCSSSLIYSGKIEAVIGYVWRMLLLLAPFPTNSVSMESPATARPAKSPKRPGNRNCARSRAIES